MDSLGNPLYPFDTVTNDALVNGQWLRTYSEMDRSPGDHQSAIIITQLKLVNAPEYIGFSQADCSGQAYVRYFGDYFLQNKYVPYGVDFLAQSGGWVLEPDWSKYRYDSLSSYLDTAGKCHVFSPTPRTDYFVPVKKVSYADFLKSAAYIPDIRILGGKATFVPAN